VTQYQKTKNKFLTIDHTNLEKESNKMKFQHLILSTLLASGITTSVYAEEGSVSKDAQADMSTMQNPQGQMPMGYYQGQPMNPMMMQRRMRMHQQNMPMMGSPETMPMSRMMQRRQQMMEPVTESANTSQPYDCPMHQMGGKRMAFMHEKMAIKQAHMKKVETHLANIEALLRKIVENQ